MLNKLSLRSNCKQRNRDSANEALHDCGSIGITVKEYVGYRPSGLKERLRKSATRA
jgi:hypothetical protein